MRIEWVLWVAVMACGGSPPGPPCPKALPPRIDEYEGYRPRHVRVGQQVTLAFHAGAPSACLELSVTGPDGPVAATLTADGTTTFLTPTPGLYTGIVRLKEAADAGAYFDSVTAIAEPAKLEACLTLPRGCSRVVDGQQRVACDETLYDREGRALLTLDGGLWFGGVDLLFAWHDGVLEQFDTSDGGARATASRPVAGKPRLWSVSRAGLALAVDDAGVAWDPGLAPIRTFAVEPDALALSLLDDGGVLVVGSNSACIAGGACAPVAGGLRAAAVDRSGVWAQREPGFRSTVLTRYESTAGGWVNAATLADDGLLFLDPLPRRPLFNTVWGLTALGLDGGTWNPEDAGTFGATDALLWSSSPTQTRAWCLP